MDVWYQDEDAQPPVMTQGMCPNRLGSGEDRAYAVSQAYVVNMPTYVEGRLIQIKEKKAHSNNCELFNGPFTRHQL